MTSIGGPCQREVCGDTHRMILRDQQVMCTHCPIPCSECACNGGRGAYCATTPCVCACHRRGPAKLRPSCMEADQARMEGTIAGLRMRALLAEAERDEADTKRELALYWQRQHITERDLAYTIGSRDGLACARQQAALVGDVLRAADAFSRASTYGDPRDLLAAVAIWVRTGRPGLSEGE